MLTEKQIQDITTIAHLWSSSCCLVQVSGLLHHFFRSSSYEVGLEQIESNPREYTKYTVSYHSEEDHYILELILFTKGKNLRSVFVPHYFGGSSGWNSGDTNIFSETWYIEYNHHGQILVKWWDHWNQGFRLFHSKRKLLVFLRGKLGNEVPLLKLLPLGDQYKVVNWSVRKGGSFPLNFFDYLHSELGIPGEDLMTIDYENLWRSVSLLRRKSLLPAEIIQSIYECLILIVRQEFFQDGFLIRSFHPDEYFYFS